MFKFTLNLREECRNFQLEEPEFKELTEINADITKIKSVWGIYEEFQNGIREYAKEDWVSFRSKTYKFDEFLQMWQDKLRKELKESNKPSTMQLKIQNDIDSLRVRNSFDFNFRLLYLFCSTTNLFSDQSRNCHRVSNGYVAKLSHPNIGSTCFAC
jgi:hypothetical protein